MRCVFRPATARRAAIAMLAGCALLAPPARAGEAPPGAAALIERLLPAVVNIATVTHTTPGPVDGNIASQPTAADRDAQAAGFFIAASGIIVTNRHSIAGAGTITVTLQDSTRLNACVLAVAAQSDIALLKVNAGMPVPVVAFGDSGRLRPGDPVFIIGNPLGLGGTVTAGIVSARDRNTAQSGFGPFFQIDAALNHGSSGGPVFDAEGTLVGIATALYSPGGETGSVGLGMAIPANDAKLIVSRLLATGRVQLGWIGVRVQSVNAELAAAVRLQSVAGAMITDIDGDGPAFRAGLAAGDVILRVGDDDTGATEALNRTIAASAVGSVVRLVVWRDGAQLSVPVVIGEEPAEPTATKPSTLPVCAPPRPASRDLGLVLGPLTTDVQNKLGLAPTTRGVLIADVVANTVAADHGLAAGAVILNANRHAVAAPAEVQAGIGAARAAGRGSVLLLVRDAQGLRWVALPLAQ